MNRTVCAALAALALAASGTSAWAHAKLVSSTPANAATVVAPKQIVLKFNETLQAKLSGAEVVMPGMNNMAVAAKASVAKDGMTLIVTPAAPLAPGTYAVKWHAVTADTHRMQGKVDFTVR